MKKIDNDEFYQNVRDFLKSKGIKLNKGPYAQRVHAGCDFLADAINATRETVARAKVEVDKQLDHLRQSIHEATAPRSPAAPPPRPSPTDGTAQAKGSKKGRRRPRRKTQG